MTEMKNICGKIPLELHTKVRQEIEEREISTQEFIQQVIEEHFNGKGEINMAVKTVAVQVSEQLYERLKVVVAAKGCKQKEFLIEIIEKAIRGVEKELEFQRVENEPEREETETRVEQENTESDEETDEDQEIPEGAEEKTEIATVTSEEADETKKTEI